MGRGMECVQENSIIIICFFYVLKLSNEYYFYGQMGFNVKVKTPITPIRNRINERMSNAITEFTSKVILENMQNSTQNKEKRRRKDRQCVQTGFSLSTSPYPMKERIFSGAMFDWIRFGMV